MLMNELAVGLNEVLDTSIAGAFLSRVGRRMYFPKGIVAQSDEAKQKADRYNATVGLATSKGQPMHLHDIMDFYKEGVFRPSEIFNYAPGGGDKTLRKIWKDEMIRKNPSLKNKLFSQPLVTAGLTHAISLCATLFFDEGDTLVLPDLFWDNYDLVFRELRGCSIRTFRFFDNGRFNSSGMKEALMSCDSEIVRILLNFPNNPTGYTPGEDEMNELVSALVSVASCGKKILVICDDAYYGLFFEEDTAKESLFSRLADIHENIFAVKGDAATKEDMVWGFRIGFITYASKGFREEHLDALVKKTLGAIRCTVSNCDRPGQSMLVKAYEEGANVGKDKAAIMKEMEMRYRTIRRAVGKWESSCLLKAYPFNSGYFMAFDTGEHSAEELRLYLLDKYGIGTINIMGSTLRLAYCSVENESLEDLVDTIFKAAGEIWN